MIVIKIILSLVIFLMPFVVQSRTISGCVYEDLNGNGIKDGREKGLSGVLVSNQRDIVAADSKGVFKIETENNELIYVIKPVGYSFSGVLAPFYLKIDEAKVDGYDFGLQKNDVGENFSMLALGDPQMRKEVTLDAFREDIIDEILDADVQFAVLMGDVADNDLSIYPACKQIVSKLPYSLFHLFGNHDADPDASGVENQSLTFKDSFGPDYYSFDEGKVHFIVLNNVLYGSENSKAKVHEPYSGGFDNIQLEWLVKDIRLVDSRKLVVLMMHIPLKEQYCLGEHIDAVFDLLKNREKVLVLSGHLHEVETYGFDKSMRWNGKASLRNLTVGACCGAWWTRPFDERGLPVSTCMDGSPNGYFKLDFNGSDYDYRFIPANHREDFQMRITHQQRELCVNIFAASDKTNVMMSIDDGEWLPISNSRGVDPFISSTHHLHYNFDEWQPALVETSHLWRAQIPNLSQGVCRVRIKAQDTDGKTYSGSKIIIIR